MLVSPSIEPQDGVLLDHDTVTGGDEALDFSPGEGTRLAHVGGGTNG